MAAGGSAAPVRHLLAERVHEQGAVVDVQGAEISIGLAADSVQGGRPLRVAENAERVQHRTKIASRRGICPIERRADGVLVARLCPSGEGGLEQVQKHVVCVVGERGRQEREVAGDARERAADAAARRQDRVGRLAGIGPVLRQHLNAAAVERRRTAGDDLVGLPRRIGLDLVDRARGEAGAAGNSHDADRVARCDRATAQDIEAADHAVAHQRAAGIDGHG